MISCRPEYLANEMAVSSADDTLSGVRIRLPELNDIDAIHDAVMESQAELSPWMAWCDASYTRGDLETWAERILSAWERGDEWHFVIVGTNDEMLGMCGIHRIDHRDHVGELGFWVRTSATGQGIASQATRQLSEWAFRVGGLHRLEIVASTENVASHRVAEKAGAMREGILRQRFALQDRRHDCVLYSILKDD